MGFMDSIIGGSKTSSSSTSGYNAMPIWERRGLRDVSVGAQTFIDPLNTVTGKVNQDAIDRFTPMAQTGSESKAITAMTKGFAPTADSLKSSIDMQMNPYDQFVIDAINRQAQGQNSILQENMSNAGQLGSNRQMFGASNLEQNRLNTVGQFEQSEYNTALQNALTTIPGLQQQDATNQMDIGAFQRALDMATKQAPVTALETAAGLQQQIGAGAGLGNTSQSESKGSSSTGLLNALGGAKGVGSVIGAFSDVRLKENIVPAGTENGHNIYVFNYKGFNDKYIGVLAHEVQEKNPDAVTEMDNGFLAVNYDKIGVEFRRQYDA